MLSGRHTVNSDMKSSYKIYIKIHLLRKTDTENSTVTK